MILYSMTSYVVTKSMLKPDKVQDILVKINDKSLLPSNLYEQSLREKEKRAGERLPLLPWTVHFPGLCPIASPTYNSSELISSLCG
jgi:hypothetical protein